MNRQEYIRTLYITALEKYFARFSDWEARAKGGRANLLSIYLARAQFDYDPGINFGFPIYFVINSGIEYDLPHTLDNIIILPPRFKDNMYIIAHEFMHVYFRNYRSAALIEFAARRGIVYINRPLMPREITNPDTAYHTGLKISGGAIVFIALEWAARETYYTYSANKFAEGPSKCSKGPSKCSKGNIRRATAAEIREYNTRLPYPQNYHPEEILAGLFANKYFQI